MDKARKLTDKELRKLEQEIYELYATSQVEISEKWRKYMQSHKKTLDKLYNELQEAKKSGDKDAISAAQEKYERAVKNVTLNDKRYKAMINETTAKMANVNQTALDYVNNEMPKVYTLNYNAFEDQDIAGYTFTLVNERAVANLAMSDKIELPYKKLDIPKDQRWNAKNINSQLAQGLLQGESIDKISKRLQNVTDMNRASAIRNARTMVTGAENKGRQDSFKKAQSDGVIMTRTWIAAHDDRTRAWHLDLHNVEVDIDEPWENEYGKIMYPGDPSADPANVYNCRCAIRAHVKGFKWNQKEDTEEDMVLDTSLPTLRNYQPAYDEFKEKRSSQIEDMAPFKKMDQYLKDMVKNNEFRMRIPTEDPGVLRSILTDGRLKTQFETRTSEGIYAPDIRKKASFNLFGSKDIKDSEYEKYGYLGSKDLVKDYNPQLGFYGDGIITFKKDSIMNRTTLTVGDSLRDAADGRFIMGTPVKDIDSTVAIGRPSMVDYLLEKAENKIETNGIECASQIGYVTRSYFELQYHGDLTLNDIDTMTADKFILDDIFKDSSLKAKVKEAGIKFNYIVGDKIIPYDLD